MAIIISIVIGIAKSSLHTASSPQSKQAPKSAASALWVLTLSLSPSSLFCPLVYRLSLSLALSRSFDSLAANSLNNPQALLPELCWAAKTKPYKRIRGEHYHHRFFFFFPFFIIIILILIVVVVLVFSAVLHHQPCTTFAFAGASGGCNCRDQHEPLMRLIQCSGQLWTIEQLSSRLHWTVGQYHTWKRGAHSIKDNYLAGRWDQQQQQQQQHWHHSIIRCNQSRPQQGLNYGRRHCRRRLIAVMKINLLRALPAISAARSHCQCVTQCPGTIWVPVSEVSCSASSQFSLPLPLSILLLPSPSASLPGPLLHPHPLSNFPPS